MREYTCRLPPLRIYENKTDQSDCLNFRSYVLNILQESTTQQDYTDFLILHSKVVSQQCFVCVHMIHSSYM